MHAEVNKRTILIHSADQDLVDSLSILLQDQYAIVATDSPETISLQRGNKVISILVIDLEKHIPELLEEFMTRRNAGCQAPIIVLYAFRQQKTEWDKSIRSLASQLLYKPVQIEQILNAIAMEERLHLRLP